MSTPPDSIVRLPVMLQVPASWTVPVIVMSPSWYDGKFPLAYSVSSPATPVRGRGEGCRGVGIWGEGEEKRKAY